MEGNGREVVTASREVGRDGRKVCLGSDLKYKTHANDYVKEEVAMEEPEARVGSSETENDITVVGNGDGILCGRQVSLFQVTLEQPSSVQVECVLKVDFLDVLVGRSADTDNVVRIPVQVERMR